MGKTGKPLSLFVEGSVTPVQKGAWGQACGREAELTSFQFSNDGPLCGEELW